MHFKQQTLHNKALFLLLSFFEIYWTRTSLPWYAMVLEIPNSVFANNESAVSTCAFHIFNFVRHEYTHMYRVISELKSCLLLLCA